jgi:hypothetical protein
MQKGVHHPSTIYTHMHILIRLYDLLLPRIWFSTRQYMRNKYAACFSLPTAPHIISLGVGGGRMQFNALVRNHSQ